MRIAIAILISSLVAFAHADGIYQWTDDNGVIHYGSQPPKDRDYSVVRKPKSERYRQWQQTEAAANPDKAVAAQPAVATASRQYGKTAEEQQAEREAARAQQAVRNQRCQKAQSNLQELLTHSRVREVDASGNQRILPEEERQQRIATARQTIRDNC